MMLDKNGKAIELGERIRKIRKGFEDWPEVAYDLLNLYIDEGEIQKAEELLQECRLEEKEYDFQDLDEWKKCFNREN